MSAEPTYLPAGLPWVLDGELRTAVLLPLSDILAESGLDPAEVLKEGGGDIRWFDSPDNTIDFRDLGRFLVHAVKVTGCPHLGLEIGRRAGMDATGAVGQAALSAPDVGSALRVIALYLHLQDHGAVPTLRCRGERFAFGYVLHVSDVPATDHIYDGALAVIQEIMRRLVGPGWKANEVRLHRRQPADITAYREVFRTRLRFCSQHAELVFPASDLESPLASADAQAHAAAIAALDEMVQLTGAGYAERIRRLLRHLLIEEEDPECAQLCQVATLLSVHPRTLNRRLRDEGTSFKELISSTRFEIARQLLRDTRLPIIEVAAALGYGDATAFIRAFRRIAGVTPAVWRSRHAVC